MKEINVKVSFKQADLDKALKKSRNMFSQILVDYQAEQKLKYIIKQGKSFIIFVTPHTSEEDICLIYNALLGQGMQLPYVVSESGGKRYRYLNESTGII